MFEPGKFADLIETKPKVPYLQELIDWLKSKDPQTEYDYMDRYNCMLCQFAQHAIKPDASWYTVMQTLDPMGDSVFGRAYHPIWGHGTTFGGALKRIADWQAKH